MADRPIAIALDYPLTLRGGVSIIVESLLKHLSPSYQVVLISPDDPQALEKNGRPAAIIRHIHFDAATLTPASAKRLVETISQEKVSLVHFHAGSNLNWGNRNGRKSPLPWLAKAGIPTLFSAHQVSPLLEGYCAENRSLAYKVALLPAVWLASTYALSYAKCIIADSKHDADLLKRNFPLSAGKTGFIYHSRLDAAQVQAQTESVREQIILAVGHIAFRKGQHILAEAFSQIAAQFPGWKLILAGPILQAECAKAIEQTKAKHNMADRIMILGSEPDPSQWMRRASIFVQPSLMEAFGLALQEAMSLGCACIGSDVGGIPELITQQKTGILVPAGDPKLLADAISELIRSPARRTELAKAAKASIIAKGVTGQAMARNYETIYERFLRTP